MTSVSQYLSVNSTRLNQAGIGTARLDILVLLEDITQKNRAWLFAHPDTQLSSNEIRRLNNLLKRRMQHQPLAYLRGRTEFYGREFVVSNQVLEPRPESETMIDLLKDLTSNRQKNARKRPPINILDVGTGCGALGITAALECPGCLVDLVDIDERALKVAKTNVEIFTLNISVIKSDLLQSVSRSYDTLLCNLPYVPDGYKINLAASKEPPLAIFGGPDGLDVYRKLFAQLCKIQQKPLYILCESMPPQQQQLKKVARKHGYSIEVTSDFIQVFKLR